MDKLTGEKACKMLEEEYPRGVELNYIDYRDCIEDPDAQQEIVATGFANDYMESCNFHDQEWEAIDYIKKELFSEFDVDDIEDEINEWCWEHNTSDPLKDMVKNSGSVFMYYDLDYYQEHQPWMQDEETRIESVKEIATHLGISYEENKEDLHELYVNAAYGGDLVLLFSADISEFYGQLKNKFVKLNAHLCIMDRSNGSGDCQELRAKKAWNVPVIRSRFRVDEAVAGYSFSGDVCGLYRPAFETQMWFNDEDKDVTKINGELEISDTEKCEIAYKEKWKTGKCSFGDMNISRHTNTPYRNDFPCGNKCTECGTFWID